MGKIEYVIHALNAALRNIHKRVHNAESKKDSKLSFFFCNRHAKTYFGISTVSMTLITPFDWYTS